jgi:hypothetical protein
VQIKEETQAGSGRKPRVETRARRCGTCGEPGHNARTCQIVVERLKKTIPSSFICFELFWWN